MEPAPATMTDTAMTPSAPAWTVDAVLRAFATAEGNLPREAIRWARDHWDSAGPRFVALLERYADGTDRSEAARDALFFVVHLLAEKRETAAFPALCRFLQDADATEAILGDAITETLRNVIISTYNGDAVAWKAVVESPTMDEFVRSAALDALPYFVRHGAFSDDEARAYLLHLRDTIRPRGENHVWPTWAIAIANLGYADLADMVQDVFRRGFVDPVSMTMDDFERDLQRTLGDPTGMAGIEFDRIGPFDDTIGTFSQWYGFSEKYRIDQAKRAERRESEAAAAQLAGPYVDPMRRVGRNDPCPCGSGKKFKKCCLQ